MLKRNIGYIAPSLVRASTFYLDRQWGQIVEVLALLLLPFNTRGGHGFAQLVLQTVMLTLLLTFFEQWMNGELKFWNFSIFGSKNKSAGDPDVGVTIAPAKDAFLF